MNNIVVHGQYTKEQLLAMSGQLVQGNKDFLSNVYINKSPEDKFGNELPVGVFTLDHKEYGKVFSKRKEPVVFRPYIRVYRYVRFDSKADNNKGDTVARTVFCKDFREEFITDDGSLKAGHKGRDGAYPDGVKVSCKIFVFGTVGFNGTNSKGEPVEIKDYPAHIKLGGKRFLDYDLLFKGLTQAGKLLFQYNLLIKAVSLGEGKYATEIDWEDLHKEQPITDEVITNLENFDLYIKTENKRVETKYNRIINKLPTEEDLKDDVVGADKPLSADFVEDDGDE